MTGGQLTRSFTLVLAGVSDVDEHLENALYEAGCDDALLGVRDGTVFLDFERDSGSLAEAVLGAIADVTEADAPARVARVEPDDPVTASEMARRLRRSRESIRQLIRGRRGPGEFPAAISSLRGSSPVWSYREVVRWFVERHRGSETDASVLADAEFVAAANEALSPRRPSVDPRTVRAVLRILRDGQSGSSGDRRP